MSEPLSISFQGAARTVTGSRHLIQFGKLQWLLDCGLYQGHRDEADRVNRTFAFEPAALDGMVVSHAHLDHIGNVPTLVAQGYRGDIHLTPATADLAHHMLEDSAFLQEKDVEHANKRARGRPPRVPLYRLTDVADTRSRFVSHAYQAPWTLFPGVTVTYYDAGHILGSALTTFEFESNGRRFRLGMSGDLGRPARAILADPEVHPGVDALVLESTYGDRLHPNQQETEDQLVAVVTRTLARGGRVLVPAFAVGRTQELVATLHRLTLAGRIPEVPIFVDSPLAREATGVFRRHPELFDAETRKSFEQQNGVPFGFARLRYIGTADESRALNDLKTPCIIVAASGMCEGGRIVHHLMHGLGDARNSVLFVGFQAEGTLGRRLRDGAEQVNVFGEPFEVHAEIAGVDGFSAHADQSELLDWVGRLDPRPRTVFLVHGEIGPMEVLARLLTERLGVTVHIPEKGERFELWT